MKYYLAAIAAFAIPGAILVAVTGVWWLFPIGLIGIATILRNADKKPAPMTRTLDGVLRPASDWQIKRDLTRRHPPVVIEEKLVGPPLPQQSYVCGTALIRERSLEQSGSANS